MNPSASKEFRKDDVVVCRYEPDDLLGKIVEKEGDGYFVDLFLYLEKGGSYVHQILYCPTSEIRYAQVVAVPVRRRKKKPPKKEPDGK